MSEVEKCTTSNDVTRGGKNTAFYAVAGEIEHSLWLKFARGENYLNLSYNVVDDIKYNHDKDGLEQKFQMLQQWAQSKNSDDNAIVELLHNLRDNFLDAECSQSQQRNPNKPGPSGINSDSVTFRSTLMELSQQLCSTEIGKVKKILAHVSVKNREFSDGEEFFFYMEDNQLWGTSCNIEKTKLLRRCMKSINRIDLCCLLEGNERTFVESKVEVKVQANDKPSETRTSGSAENSPSGCMSSLFGCIGKWKVIRDKKKVNEAAAVATEIANIAVECDDSEKKELYSQCYPALVDITKCCIEDKQCGAGTLMALSRFAILRECCEEDISALLESLEQVGDCFVILATNNFALGESEEAMQLCVYIDNIIEFMFNVCSFNNDNTESMVKKNQFIFSVLLRYGPLCITVKNFPKALAIFSQAVTMIKTLYGRDAKKLKVLVECYYNIGVLYNEFKQPYQAINVIKDAICTCDSVDNWEKKDEKSYYVVMCTKFLEHLEHLKTSAKP